MSTLKDFDTDRLDMLFGRDKSMVDEIVEIVLTDFPISVKKLEAAISEKDITAITHLSHTLKGSVANVGGDKTSDSAKKIHDAAKEEDFTSCSELFPQFEQDILKFFEELKKYQGSLST